MRPDDAQNVSYADKIGVHDGRGHVLNVIDPSHVKIADVFASLSVNSVSELSMLPGSKRNMQAVFNLDY